MSKRVPIKEIKDAIRSIDNEPVKFTFGSKDNSIEIEFKPYLSLTDELIFVQRVVNGTFIGNEYHIEYKNIVFTSVLLDMMSNLTLPYSGKGKDKVIDLSTLKDWDNVFHFKDTILYWYKSYGDSDNNSSAMFALYVDYLETLVNDKIGYIINQNLKHSKFDDLIDEIRRIIKKMDNKLENIDIKEVTDLMKKINKIDDSKIIDILSKKSN